MFTDEVLEALHILGYLDKRTYNVKLDKNLSRFMMYVLKTYFYGKPELIRKVYEAMREEENRKINDCHRELERINEMDKIAQEYIKTKLRKD